MYRYIFQEDNNASATHLTLHPNNIVCNTLAHNISWWLKVNYNVV
jgi:hypothetical protein